MTHRIEVLDGLIEGYVENDLLPCITLYRALRKWKVGGSTCLPTNLDDAREIVDCMTAALNATRGCQNHHCVNFSLTHIQNCRKDLWYYHCKEFKNENNDD